MHLKTNLKSTECTYYLYIKKSKFLNKKQLLVHFVPCHHLIYVNVSSLKILERAYVSLLSFSSKGPSIKDVGISLAVFDTPPPPHVGISTLI